jgi:hypothetical protein
MRDVSDYKYNALTIDIGRKEFMEFQGMHHGNNTHRHVHHRHGGSGFAIAFSDEERLRE